MNLDLARTDRARSPRTTHRQLDLGHALHRAALGTYKVRMRTVVLVGDGLEPPHVIADIGAPSQAGLREIDEVAIDRRAIPPVRCEPIRSIAVRDRRITRTQELEHGEPRRRGT